MKKYFILFLTIFMVQLVFGLPDKIVDVLSLDEDQQEEIESIILENESEKQELLIELQIKQLELKQLVLKDNLKKSAIKDKLEEIAEIEVEIRFLRFKQDIEILEELDDDQKKRYKYFRIKRYERYKGRRDKKYVRPRDSQDKPMDDE